MVRTEAYKKAEKRVAGKIGFKIHFVVFFVVMALLAYINFSSGAEYLWVKWPLLGWGIGLLFHGLSAYVIKGKSLITEEMVRREMEKDQV